MGNFFWARHRASNVVQIRAKFRSAKIRTVNLTEAAFRPTQEMVSVTLDKGRHIWHHVLTPIVLIRRNQTTSDRILEKINDLTRDFRSRRNNDLNGWAASPYFCSVPYANRI